MRLELIDDVLVWLDGYDLAKTGATSLKVHHEITRRLEIINADNKAFNTLVEEQLEAQQGDEFMVSPEEICYRSPYIFVKRTLRMTAVVSFDVQRAVIVGVFRPGHAKQQLYNLFVKHNRVHDTLVNYRSPLPAVFAILLASRATQM